MKCIVCRSHLEDVSEGINQPSRGVEFTSRGHYGSTVFDPMDGTAIAINVCDGCLADAGADGLVLEYEPQQVVQPPRVTKPWSAQR